ncbi:IPExxxVDY family protein [uncultured Tenacibaculum sp.]|uniref:IPExxxVDY family protein n=1 Tax=uncultured Tenacibaculum sp. TaxID=174713 RepID=UPI00262B498F|nr:IPExxxVDY family protein [uncultured Tenacibaculum sp.]
MQIHSLTLDDFSSTDYSLIGIHSPVEDYRLAYLLNLHLQLNLKRSDFDIDVTKDNIDAFFSLYEFTHNATENSWYLISNYHKNKVAGNNLSLFSESQTVTYLLPERKKVDYFLKLEGDFNSMTINKTIESINKIPQIVTSYSIDTNKLKSKESLIF